jgi:hypothetical protein
MHDWPRRACAMDARIVHDNSRTDTIALFPYHMRVSGASGWPATLTNIVVLAGGQLQRHRSKHGPKQAVAHKATTQTTRYIQLVCWTTHVFSDDQPFTGSIPLQSR